MTKNTMKKMLRSGVRNLTAEETAGLLMWAMGLAKQNFRDQEIREYEKGIEALPEMTEEEKEDAIERSFGELQTEDRERQYWLPCECCKDHPKFFNKRVGQWWFKDEQYGHDGKWKLCTNCNGKGGWHDDPSKPEAYWTLSGDMNGTKDWMREMYGQQIARNFRELAPAKVRYATSMWPRATTGLERQMIAAIKETDNIPENVFRCIWGYVTKLNEEGKFAGLDVVVRHVPARQARREDLWKKFWKLVYSTQRKYSYTRNGVTVAEENNGGRQPISPRWVSRISKMFAARGVVSDTALSRTMERQMKAVEAVMAQRDKQF